MPITVANPVPAHPFSSGFGQTQAQKLIRIRNIYIHDVTPTPIPTPVPSPIIDWTRRFGNGGIVEAHGVAVDSSGNVCVVGPIPGTLPGYTLLNLSIQ